MKQLENFRKMIRLLMQSEDAPPPNPLRKAIARRSLVQHAARLRSKDDPAQASRRLKLTGWQRRAVSWAMACVLTFGLATGGVQAADRSRPGDLLYPLDRDIEQLQLALEPNPDQKVILLFSFADERLLEIQQLAEDGDVENMVRTLDAYRTTILTIERVAQAEFSKIETLITQIDDEFVSQEERLLSIRPQVSEEAHMGLDLAIEAIRHGHENIQVEDDLLEETEESPPTNIPSPAQGTSTPGFNFETPGGPPGNIRTGPPSGVSPGPPSWVPGGPPRTPQP